MLTEEVIRSTRSRLLSRAWAVRTAEFENGVERQFTAQQIRSGAAGQDVGQWLTETLGNRVSNPAVYLISAGNVETAVSIRHAFVALPNEQARGYRLPKHNLAVEDRVALYVGGSESIRRRLREHLGEAPVKTYALNMRRWCPEFEGVVTVKVQTFSPEANRDCRQDLEDTLWDSLLPIFGKRGAR